ncbi:S9 family peptidase [Kribbella antibiotica]|uniref:prolyl oligopeptidase n=1 Tax=Kribbella antibiotica TaxID=190195 RepID=A0A4R4ZX67_9ACTN|nr:prolyl oligopeptidase family serine peptidase [Kribbella antibiotica]TDD62894.1 S9 family peptidase [Kribbella antibiotica]
MCTVPDSRRGEVVEVLHGQSIADPYRWLEDAPGDWIAQQNAAAEEYLSALPQRQYFENRLREILARARIGVPVFRAGRYVFEYNNGTRPQTALCTAVSLDVEPQVLLQFEDGTTAIDSFSVSPDGRYVACATRSEGNPRLTFRVIDLEIGQQLADLVEDAKYCRATWLPDSRSFVYVHASADSSEIGGHLSVHQLGDPQSLDRMILELPPGSVSDTKVAAEHLVVQLNEGTEQRTRLWLFPLPQLTNPIKLIDEPVAATRFVRTAGDRLVLWTDLDAPRGRVVTCTVDDPAFVDLVPESDDALTAVQAAGNGLLIVTLHDAHPRFQLVDLEGAASTVDLQGGAVVAVTAQEGQDDILIGLSSTSAPTELAHVNATTAQATWLRRGSTPPHRVLRGLEPSRGVPYFLISRADLSHTAPRPTMLYGYGGFRSPQLADHRPDREAWLESGGVLVIANLRGGGEFGADWHDAGRLSRKQNTYDDFIAVAEHLQATGITTREQLAIHGHSGGGMLVGAVLTQRPELFAAALPTAGVMDMLRFHLFTIGRAWAPEIGLPEDPEQFADLLAWSPLHNVRPGTRYPAVLVLTSDHDEVVVPLHSYKFAAALQHAQTGAEPILLRIETRTGHGPGRPTSAIAAEATALLSFTAARTGLHPES